jgi:alanyl-tRNA synthetase
MSTHRLYYDDSYLQYFDARLEECIPAGTFPTDAGTVPVWEVVLDRSAFYPASGGQPNDLGKLDEANVLDVHDEGDEIVHIVDQELPKGTVHGCVNWPRRFDHMQQHTGQHLLSAVFQERYGLETVSFHLGTELCTIDLRGPEPEMDILQGAQRAANSIIFQNRAVQVRYGTAEQLAAQGARKEVDRQGILRAIEIEAVDLQPCGGTHIKSTGQIGLILVRRCRKIRQDWRLEFVCGHRASHFAAADFHLLRIISERLSCGPEEALAVIEKTETERAANYKSLRAATQQLAEARTRLLVTAIQPQADGSRFIIEVLPEESAELLLPLATELAKHDRTVALLIHAATGQLVFAQNPTTGNDLAALLREVLAAVPGKGGGTHDFARAKLIDPARSAEALELAHKLLSGVPAPQSGSASTSTH